MAPALYLETTIIGYLASRPSSHLVTAAHQQVTREWWERRRTDFDLFTSELVLLEAARGDRDTAAERLELLRDIPVLGVTDEAQRLAGALVEQRALPAVAQVDALHVSIAAVQGVDYLLTWNCRHIANASLRGTINSVCLEAGFEPPTICTPDELLAEEP